VDTNRSDRIESRVRQGFALRRGRQEDRRLIAGGGTRKVDGKGLFIEPTVFADADNDIRISRDEIFGPVVPVIAFKDEDEAVRLDN
jgi:aldehyde dehydrogenase (NAD+)